MWLAIFVASRAPQKGSEVVPETRHISRRPTIVLFDTLKGNNFSYKIEIIILRRVVFDKKDVFLRKINEN